MYNPEIIRTVYDEVPRITNFTSRTKTIMDVIAYVRTMKTIADTGTLFSHSRIFYVDGYVFTIFAEHQHVPHDNRYALSFLYGDGEERGIDRRRMLSRRHADILDYALYHLDRPIIDVEVFDETIIGTTYTDVDDLMDDLKDISTVYESEPLYDVLYKASRIEDIMDAYDLMEKEVAINKTLGIKEKMYLETYRVPFKDGRAVDLESDKQLHYSGYRYYFVIRDKQGDIIRKLFYETKEELRRYLYKYL